MRGEIAEIRDTRHIRFPREVLPAVLLANPAALGLRMAPAEIEHVAVQSLEPPELRVSFRQVTAAPVEQRVIAGAALAAALIAYCKQVRLPISRRARKSVVLDDDAVVLITHLRMPLGVTELQVPMGA